MSTIVWTCNNCHSIIMQHELVSSLDSDGNPLPSCPCCHSIRVDVIPCMKHQPELRRSA